jgi:hypothetical protein
MYLLKYEFIYNVKFDYLFCIVILVAAPKKSLKFKTSTDASEAQVIDAMQKISSHINNPAKFSKAAKLAIQLIEAGSVKSGVSDYFFAILEAAMLSPVPCTDASVRADYHALFSSAQNAKEVRLTFLRIFLRILKSALKIY